MVERLRRRKERKGEREWEREIQRERERGKEKERETKSLYTTLKVTRLKVIIVKVTRLK